MEINRTIKQHKAEWNELEQLLGQLSRPGASRLRAEDIDRFHMLYRAASAHLAALQTSSPTSETTHYLHQLVARAHNAMYRENNKSGKQLSVFLLHHFPALIRACHGFIWLAMALFVLGGLAGYIAVQMNPAHLTAIVPPQMAGAIQPELTAESRGELFSPLVSTMIMTNNIRVAVLAFVSGITFGIGTVALLVYNGLLIGALAAVFARAGYSYVFWAYILPHGVIELAAIFIAGGAGLYMGYRMFVPGPFSRKHRFVSSAKQSVQLLLGTVPLFIIAGIIEGYITPSDLSLEMKYAIAALTLFWLAAYYIYGVLRPVRHQADEAMPYSASRSFSSK